MKLNNKTKNARKNFRPSFHNCPNCGERITGGHFVPPSLGEDGFYICEFANLPKNQVDLPDEAKKLIDENFAELLA